MTKWLLVWVLVLPLACSACGMNAAPDTRPTVMDTGVTTTSTTATSTGSLSVTTQRQEEESSTTTATAVSEVDPGAIAAQVTFRVFWLGASFKGLRLRAARLESNGRVTMQYNLHTAGEPPQPTGNEVFSLYEFSASDSAALESLDSGLKGSGAKAQQVHEGGEAWTLWTGGTAWPTLVRERSGTVTAISAFGYTDSRSVLSEAAQTLEQVSG